MVDLVCNIDAGYVEHCGVMLTSLFVNNAQQKFRVHIIHSGIGDKAKKRLATLKESFSVDIIFYDVPYSGIEKFPIKSRDHLSLAAYLRMFMSELLPDTIDKVLYLDCDLIVLDSIQELWNLDMDGYAVAAVEERPPFDKYSPVDLGYPPEYSYFNSGVMLIDLKCWREMDLVNKGKKYIEENYKAIKHHDQDVLNALLYDKKKFISIRWNLMDFFQFIEPEIQDRRLEDLCEALKNPVIVHFTGSRKPWLHNCDSPFRDHYVHFAKKYHWNVLNGTECIHYHLRKMLYNLLYAFNLKQRKSFKNCEAINV